MNCVNTGQQLKGFCLISDQDNFNIKISTAKEVLTTKDRIERKLHSCYYMKGVKNLQNGVAPTRNRLLDAEEETKIVLSTINIPFIRWTESQL